MSSKDTAKIEEILHRGVENAYPSHGALKAALESGKKLRVYLGIDPTGPSLHLGHAIPMRKLALLQDLGHEVILLIGDFTAMIGDPTDKTAARKRLTRKEVLANCKNYKKQASKILKFTESNPAKLMFNSKWHDKLRFGDVVELAANFTVQQMSERDMFDTRLKEGRPVYLHEFLYPLMQGFDSVAMNVDMEVGGNDQTFNMLVGRDLMKAMKGQEKFVLATSLLTDPSGKKMGKTEGNIVALDDSPEEMYGKVMSWSDELIVSGFKLCTVLPMDEIVNIEKRMKGGENPVAYKRKLAHAVVASFISAKAADQAGKSFTQVHREHEAPKDMPTLNIRKGMTLIDALVASGLVSSKSDARRQIEQGGVKVDGEVVKDMNARAVPRSVLQKGKRHFVKLV